MLTVNNNLMASNAARNLSKSYNSLAGSIEKLSSGLRINSAKDDAAGLAVRESMRAEISVLRQGSRNAQDGISMLQTMEGAMATIDDILVRMRELAEQSATGSYSDAQRALMDAEFVQLAAEIDRITEATTFNGISLLDNAATTVAIHVGTASTIDADAVDMTSATLGVDAVGATIDTAANAILALATVATAIDTKDAARATFGSIMNRLESTISVVDIQAENLQVAESRISDVDMATEMANFTSSQVLAQAGISMLAQANTVPQMALTLLR